LAEESSVVDLGFVAARVPHGAHICQVYSSDAERDHALRLFLARGLLAQEATACFSDAFDPGVESARFTAEGLSLSAEQRRGRFVCSSAESVYFEGGRFDPERMYQLIVAFYDNAVASGCSGARVIGEMSPSILKIEGGSRLFEYEAGVNSILRDHPVTAVCQYDARRFDGATIMDVLSVHPLMFIHGAVIQNPFFVAPERLIRH
jgi:hypothetical protein